MAFDLDRFADNLRNARRNSGRSQNALAFISRVSLADISRFENAKLVPSRPQLARIAAALEVSVDDLVPEPVELVSR